MESWLNEHAPRKFSELAMPLAYQETLINSSLNANPPHILLAGPSGVGKTATWKLFTKKQVNKEKNRPKGRKTTNKTQP